MGAQGRLLHWLYQARKINFQPSIILPKLNPRTFPWSTSKHRPNHRQVSPGGAQGRLLHWLLRSCHAAACHTSLSSSPSTCVTHLHVLQENYSTTGSVSAVPRKLLKCSGIVCGALKTLPITTNLLRAPMSPASPSLCCTLDVVPQGIKGWQRGRFDPEQCEVQWGWDVSKIWSSHSTRPPPLPPPTGTSLHLSGFSFPQRRPCAHVLSTFMHRSKS